MTKLYEEYWRGEISRGIEYFKSKDPRGEFTLVIEGKMKEERSLWTEEELLKAIKKELKSGKSAKEISAELAEQSGWNKKEVYALINQSK
jgi:16S rRNA (cytidine1402-2'-O)-methyltransferase